MLSPAAGSPESGRGGAGRSPARRSGREGACRAACARVGRPRSRQRSCAAADMSTRPSVPRVARGRLVVTDKVSRPRSIVPARLRQLDHLFGFGVADAHLRPRRHGGRPRRPARGAVARSRRRPPRVISRPAPAEYGGVPVLARSADLGRALQPAASSASTPTRRRRSRPSTPARTSSSSRRPRRARRSATRCRCSRRSPTTRQSRALFLFPTKALGQDQVAEFAELSRAAGMSIVGRDVRRRHAGARSGRRSARRARSSSRTRTCSTPAILPHHTKWFQLFEQLRVIVIDELHTYRGVFGSHVANVIRRLLRLCAHYGSHPVIVCCSATIANPAELAAMLTGRPSRLIDRNGAPAGERHVLLVDPPVIDAATGARGSAADAREPLGAAVPAGRPPDDRVRAGPDRGRDPADRAARVAARGVRAAVEGPRLPRRLPADRAAGDRARPARRRDPRRRRDERARAGRRHRPPRRLDPRRLPGLGRRDVAADRPGRPAQRDERRDPRRVGARRSTSTSSTTRSSCSTGRRRRPGSIPDNLHVLLAHLRAATFEMPFEPGEVFGPGPRTTCSRSSSESGHVRQAERRQLVLELGELPGLGDLAADRGAGERRDHRHDARTGRGSSARSTSSAPRSSSTTTRSTSTSRSSTTSTSSTGASARRTSTRSTPTTTRTPTGR